MRSVLRHRPAVFVRTRTMEEVGEDVDEAAQDVEEAVDDMDDDE